MNEGTKEQQNKTHTYTHIFHAGRVDCEDLNFVRHKIKSPLNKENTLEARDQILSKRTNRATLKWPGLKIRKKKKQQNK